MVGRRMSALGRGSIVGALPIMRPRSKANVIAHAVPMGPAKVPSSPGGSFNRSLSKKDSQQGDSTLLITDAKTFSDAKMPRSYVEPIVARRASFSLPQEKQQPGSPGGALPSPSSRKRASRGISICEDDISEQIQSAIAESERLQESQPAPGLVTMSAAEELPESDGVMMDTHAEAAQPSLEPAAAALREEPTSTEQGAPAIVAGAAAPAE